MSKSTKPWSIEIDSKRIMRCNKYVNTHIELFMSYEKWVVNISLNYVGLGLSAGIWPIRDLSNASKQEYTFSLTTPDLND